MKQRLVTTALKHGVWWVLYVERRKHQHYAAAQFYAKDYTLKQVQEWVMKQPRLRLIRSEKPTIISDSK